VKIVIARRAKPDEAISFHVIASDQRERGNLRLY